MNIFHHLRNSTPFNKLTFTALAVTICAVLALILTTLGAYILFGLSVEETHSAGTSLNPENVVMLKFSQTVQSIFIFIIPSILIAFVLSDSPAKFLRVNRISTVKNILLAIAITYCAHPAINLLVEVNMQMKLPHWMGGVEERFLNWQEHTDSITTAFLSVGNLWGVAFNIFMIALLPAIGEEMLFRGVVQRLFYEWINNHHAAIWISAAIFSALHLQFYGFMPRMVLGGMFGYMFAWSGSLWVPVIAHFINNALAVVIYYTCGETATGLGSKDNIYPAFISFIIVIALMRILYLYGKKTQAQR